jgi:hypothetical protein
MEALPILLLGNDHFALRTLELAFEQEGIRMSMHTGSASNAQLAFHPASVLYGDEGLEPSNWLEYVRQGGLMIVCNPSRRLASEFGLECYSGSGDNGTLFIMTAGASKPVHIQIPCTFEKYGKASGTIMAYLRDPYAKGKDFPGIVQYSVGLGKALLLLFSLPDLVNYIHQRTISIAERTKKKSAEAIALSGVTHGHLDYPQVDILMSFLSHFLVFELLARGKPVPRFAYLPFGARNLMTFSFDDFCPSGFQIKQAISGLLAWRPGNGVGGPLSNQDTGRRLLRAFLGYGFNYKADVLRVISLFRKYGSTATAFLLPFLGFVKNKPFWTGYKGFSLDSFGALKHAGWDVGTHVNPSCLDDYHVSQRKFKQRFQKLPAGHRGHELGWLNWDSDWQNLESLGYLYDSTWCRGGSPGITWILGTAFPFHPVDRNGKHFSILEVPVAAWIEDLYKNPEASLLAIDAALDSYAGVFNFGAHSWKTKDDGYLQFIERILLLGKNKPNLCLGLNLADICRFWMDRQKSTYSDIHWDATQGCLSFRTNSQRPSNDLAVYIPYKAWNRKINTARVNGTITQYRKCRIQEIDYAIVDNNGGGNFHEITYA